MNQDFKKLTTAIRDNVVSIAIALLMLALLILFFYRSNSQLLEKQNKILKDSIQNLSKVIAQQKIIQNQTSLITKQSEIIDTSLKAIYPGSVQSAIQSKDSSLIKSVNRISKGVVYVQISSKDFMKNGLTLLKYLKSAGYTTPPIQVVTDFQFPNSIKYFNTQDKASAEGIENICKKLYPNKNYELLSFAGSHLKAPIGQIEIWVNFDVNDHAQVLSIKKD